MFVLLAILREFCQVWSNQAVLFQSDNSTTVSAVNRQGSPRAAWLLHLTGDLLELAEEHNVHIVAYFLPGRFNLEPDALSRPGKALPEWHLLPAAAHALWSILGIPTLDLFASSRSRQVHRYVSFDVTDSHAAWHDAFSRQWDGELLWIFPPPTMIPQVLDRLQQCRSRFYLLLPWWEAAWWLSRVQKIATRVLHPPVVLVDHLIDLSTGQPPPRVHDIQLSLWISCSRAGSTRN